MASNTGEKIRVYLSLKPMKYDITYNPRPESRDFDVTQCGRLSVSKEVVERYSPAEEKVKTILEFLAQSGKISLIFQAISTKGVRGFLNRNKKPSVVCYDENGSEKALVIDDTVDEKKLFDFIGLPKRI
jgi:hypothetical protein